jgi:hypothetical protein
MNLDIGSITRTMTDAVRAALGERWSAIRGGAEPEFRKLAETLEDVQQMYAKGDIDMNRAFELVEMQRNTAFSVLKSVKGLGILTARQAIEAAAHAAGTVVNRLLGFTVISSTTTSTPVSQEPAKSSSTGGTQKKGSSPDSPAKPARRPVKAKFKAGKDL